MIDPFITLTTDFGTDSPFVAAMKGVILSINPAVRIVDLSHDLPPFNLLHASFFLTASLPYFPAGTLHVVVVDPGVGSDRSILHVAVAGQRLLVPDNGCWTRLAEGQPHSPQVHRVSEPRFWRTNISATFHGRDIFAPVAAHLSLSVSPADLGPVVTDWQKLAWPTPSRHDDYLQGEVIFVDHFGNLITNISATDLAGTPPHARITYAPGITLRRVRAYADAPVGELVALVSSNGLLEVAEVQGNAGRRLGLHVGSVVLVDWQA